MLYSIQRLIKRIGRIGNDEVVVDNDCVKVVKAQMEAYGFINFYPAEQVGGGVSEFGSLTERGKKKLLEISVVRKVLTEPDDSPPA